MVGHGLHRVDQRRQGQAAVPRPLPAPPAGRPGLLRPAACRRRARRRPSWRASYGIEAFCYYHYWFGGKRPARAALRRGAGRRASPISRSACAGPTPTWTGIWHGNPPGAGRADLPRRATTTGPTSSTCCPPSATSATSRSTASRCSSSTSRRTCRTPRRWRRGFGRHGGARPACPASTWWGVAHRGDWDPAARRLRRRGSMQNLPGLTGQVPWRYPLLRAAGEARRPSPDGLRLREPRRDLRPDKTRQLEYLPCLIPSWDNTPRSGMNGLVMHGSTPELFRRSVRQALENVADKPPSTGWCS